MDRIRQALEDVESSRFMAKVGVASDFDTFLAGAAGEDSVQRLVGAATDQDVRRFIVARALKLARRAGDPRYESRWDTALTVYLWVLSETADDGLPRMLAEALLTGPQLWWARKLALHVYGEQRHRSAAKTVERAAETLEVVWATTSRDSLDAVSIVQPNMAFVRLEPWQTNDTTDTSGMTDPLTMRSYLPNVLVNTNAEAA